MLKKFWKACHNAHANRVKIKENSWLAKLAARKLKSDKMAMVIGHTIHLHNTTKEEFLNDERWLRHELKHVEQYKKHGVAGFLCKYLWQSLRHGYHDNVFEKEARESETEISKINFKDFN
ncbi:MAG: DUF4157 domain-containing protein [Chitinophagaceae bacterium]|nr:DUF4157 domain-containing protein [Chitinophagaceae bacterium]